MEVANNYTHIYILMTSKWEYKYDILNHLATPIHFA